MVIPFIGKKKGKGEELKEEITGEPVKGPYGKRIMYPPPYQKIPPKGFQKIPGPEGYPPPPGEYPLGEVPPPPEHPPPFDKAMNMMMGPPEEPPPPYPPPGIPPEGMPEGEMPPMPMKAPPVTPTAEFEREHIEEIVEKVIEEKWKSAQTKFEEFDGFKMEVIEQISLLKDQLADLKSRYVELQEQSTIRLEEYSKELESVGAQIGALQKVLQRIFPTIAENVRELSDIVRDMRKWRARVIKMSEPEH
jgi:hypothetical protein